MQKVSMKERERKRKKKKKSGYERERKREKEREKKGIVHFILFLSNTMGSFFFFFHPSKDLFFSFRSTPVSLFKDVNIK
jgi:hypothetical protein